MFPLYLDPKEEYCQFHGKQAFVINRFFLVIVLGWFVAFQFVPINFNHYAYQSLIGIAGIYLFCMFCGLGTALFKLRLPYFAKRADNVKL